MRVDRNSTLSDCPRWYTLIKENSVIYDRAATILNWSDPRERNSSCCDLGWKKWCGWIWTCNHYCTITRCREGCSTVSVRSGHFCPNTISPINEERSAINYTWSKRTACRRNNWTRSSITGRCRQVCHVVCFSYLNSITSDRWTSIVWRSPADCHLTSSHIESSGWCSWQIW